MLSVPVPTKPATLRPSEALRKPRRLQAAAEEIRNYELYDYVLVNRVVEQSVDTLASIVKAERIRRTRVEDEIRPILDSFMSFR